MKNTNKKGFTIVELVIVIAVIAILAAVLIPTFSGVVSKANESAALQTAKNSLSNALSMSSTAALQGTAADGTLKTVFVCDGYAFEYQGNTLSGIDYPAAKGSKINALTHYGPDADANAARNFNAIMLASQNITTVYYDANSAYEANKTLTGARLTTTVKEAAVLYSYTEYKALDGNSEVTEDAFTALPAENKTKTAAIMYTKEECNEYNAAYVTGAKKVGAISECYIVAGISEIIDAVSDLDIATNATTLPLNVDTDGNYTLTSGTDTIKVYVNSDFSKKLVIFTTIG